MPDNNVAETARSPPGLLCPSVWSHRDDVTAFLHMCCAGLKGKNLQTHANQTQVVPCFAPCTHVFSNFFTSLLEICILRESFEAQKPALIIVNRMS